MNLYRSPNNGVNYDNNALFDSLIVIPSMLAWPFTLPVILGLQLHYYPKQTELKDLEYWCSRIKKGLTDSDNILSLEYKYLSRDFVIDELKAAFAENDAIKKLTFPKHENITYGEIYRILRYNTSVREVGIPECKVTKRLQNAVTRGIPIGVYCRSFDIESEGYFFNRDSDKFVVGAFLDNLERYSKGWSLGTKHPADKHFERAASFLQRLKAENIETKRGLISKVKQQLDLWLGNNEYSIELQSPNCCSVKLDKHERNIITRDYGDYFHLLADLESDLKLNVFLKLYISQLKGEIKLQKLDVEAIRAYCEIPEQKQKLDAAFEKALANNVDVLEAFKANQYLFTTNFVPHLLANMVAPTGFFPINPQTKTEQTIESIQHHLPYLVLGIATAGTLAFKKGGYLALLLAPDTSQAVTDMIHGFEEFVHLVKAAIHGKDLIGHEHVPKLGLAWKWLFGVEADTSDQINFFNQSTCKSMKDPKEMYDFSGYLLESLNKVIPFSALYPVKDDYHTHIKDIRTLIAFFLCMSCLKFGYLPQGNSLMQTDEDLVNKMMFVLSYLGSSVQEIKSCLKGDTSSEVKPKLRRGLIQAKYKNEQGEWIEIQWSWDADMKVSVKPFNRSDAVTLSFEEKEDAMLTRRAMPFEISLLKSMLSQENAGEPISLPTLSGVEFMEAKLPQISTDSSVSINSSKIAMEDLRKNMHTLEGIKDYQEYRTTQRKFEEHDQRIETLELDRELDRKEIAELKKSLFNLLNPQNDQGRIIEEKDTQIKELEQKNKKLENKLQEQDRLLHPSLRLERRSKSVDLLRTNQSRIFKQRILQDEKFDDVDSGNNSQLKI